MHRPIVKEESEISKVNNQNVTQKVGVKAKLCSSCQSFLCKREIK